MANTKDSAFAQGNPAKLAEEQRELYELVDRYRHERMDADVQHVLARLKASPEPDVPPWVNRTKEGN